MNFTEKLELIRSLNNDLNEVDKALQELAQTDGTAFTEMEFAGDSMRSSIALKLPADVLADMFFTLKTRLEGKRTELIEKVNKMIK